MPRQLAMVTKMRQAIDRQQVVAPGDTLVVAVSGGPDSVALVHCLVDIDRYHLHVAHLNHGLRGVDSEADAAFVSHLADQLGLPATIDRAGVTNISLQRGRGIEEAARHAPYSFLAAVSRQASATAVALGHTADDQAETLLLHLLRGAGLRGLRGMTPASVIQVVHPGSTTPVTMRLLRPMLGITRAEVEAYCQKEGLEYRLDDSNADTSLNRNWVRHVVLPLLAGRFPGVGRSLGRTASLLAADLEYIEARVTAGRASVMSTMNEGGSARLEFDLTAWAGLHPLEQRYLLHSAGREMVGDPDDLTEERLEAAAEAMNEGQVGTVIEWPHGLRIVKGYQRFRLEQAGPDRSPVNAIGPLLPPEPAPLAAPGGTRFGDWEIIATERKGRCDSAGLWHADVPAPAAGHSLVVRARRPGDRMRPLGMDGAKKVQDLMVDAKIPRAKRTAWPLVVTGDSILWVPGIAVAEEARVCGPEEESMCLQVRRVGE